MVGENFGLLGPKITLNGKSLSVVSFNHTYVSFYVPEGQGYNLPVVVNVSSQLSSATPIVFSYAPPVVTSFEPSQLNGDTRGGEVITLHGSNFGTFSFLKLVLSSIHQVIM